METGAATQVEAPVFGRYWVHELLGRGGMGTVHRAYDTEHRRMVALKRLPDAGIDEWYRARFRREARLAAAFVHPHAVPVHDFGEIDGQLYLDMMLVDGSDLRRLLGSGALRAEQAVAILGQVASALDAAHAAGLVHRDVKPSNILVDHGGHAYLADFGIARSILPDATGVTHTGDPVLGTWDYLAPERLSRGPVDGRADQYSLACVLFECLTGRLPHPGGEPAAVMAGHLLTPAPAPSLFAATVSPALDALVLRGMAKDPAHRFPSCTALLAAAQEALRDGPPAAAAPATAAEPVDPAQEWLIRAIVRAGARRPAGRAAPAGHADETVPPPCPYPGLRSFERADADWFHGRDRMVTDLLVRLAEQVRYGEPVVLVGASGSGKSSLLRAGVLPALDTSDAAPQLVCTPGADPIGALAAALAPLLDEPAGELADGIRRTPAGFGRLCRRLSGPGPARPVLVVDQLEELFSHEVPDADRLAFATALASAAPALVLLAVRADLVERCVELASLRAALAAPVFLGPLSETELRQAIVTPAQDAGVAVEPGLPERLMADLGVRGDGSYDPAALPRLAHALRETWQEGGGVALTLDGYRRAGGVDGAVARTAEQVYSDLDDAGRGVARTLLLRLVIVPDEGPAVRRRVGRDVLDSVDGGAGVLGRLVAARLVTVDEAGARISHEALLTAWPRLRDWIEADRAGLAQHRRLTEAVQAWRASDEQPDDLYRGARLAALDAWLESAGDRVRLDAAEQEFLTRSRAADRAEAADLRRRTRRLRALVAALTVLLLIAGVAVVVATRSRSEAVDARQLALSRQLAASSELAAAVDPRRAALLALGAWQAAPTPEARSALLATASDPFRGTMAGGHESVVNTVTMSADGRVAASGGVDGTLRLWDVPSRREVARLAEAGGWYRTVSMSADGRLLLAVDMRRHRAELWDVPYRRLLHTVPEEAYDGALSPDGRRFVAAVDPGVMVVRDTSTFAEVSRFPLTPSQRITFSPDGSLIATTDRHDVLLTRAADGTRLATMSGHTGDVSGVAFDRSGTHLASSSNDGTVRLWQVAGGVAVRTLDPVDTVGFSVAFRSDDRLVVGDSVSGISVWDPTTGTLLGRVLTTAQGIASLAVSGDGHTVIGGSMTGPITVWELGRTAYTFTDLAVVAASPQPRGPLLVAVTGDGGVWLWNRVTGEPARRLADEPGRRSGAAFSPDGTRLATVGDDGTVRVRDVATSAVVGQFTVAGTELSTVAFSPDGARLAVGTDITLATLVAAQQVVDHEGEVLLLDATRMALLHRLPTGSLPTNPQATDDDGSDATDSSNDATALAFSPDGRSLVAPLSGGRVAVWDLAEPMGPPRMLDGNSEMATDAAFTPDGSVLATTGADRSVRLWPLPDGTGRTLAHGVTPTRAVAFSPDGAVFATASQDTLLRVWAMPDGRPLAVIDRHNDALNDVAFDDAGRLVSAAADGSVQVWDLDTDRAVRTLCQVLDPATIADSWRGLGPDLGDPPRCPE
jgi:WD40 repeat protein